MRKKTKLVKPDRFVLVMSKLRRKRKRRSLLRKKLHPRKLNRGLIWQPQRL